MIQTKQLLSSCICHWKKLFLKRGNLLVLRVTLGAKPLTLEKLRSHGFVDELRGPVHQSDSGVQVIVHHSDVKSRLTQSTWVAQVHK